MWFEMQMHCFAEPIDLSVGKAIGEDREMLESCNSTFISSTPCATLTHHRRSCSGPEALVNY